LPKSIKEILGFGCLERSEKRIAAGFHGRNTGFLGVRKEIRRKDRSKPGLGEAAEAEEKQIQTGN
jgi:hypothetical protein